MPNSKDSSSTWLEDVGSPDQDSIPSITITNTSGYSPPSEAELDKMTDKELHAARDMNSGRGLSRGFPLAIDLDGGGLGTLAFAGSCARYDLDPGSVAVNDNEVHHYLVLLIA